MIGRDVRLPVDLLYGHPPQSQTKMPLSEYVARQCDLIEEAHEFARDNLQISAESQKKHYDHRTKRSGFEVNDQVWMYYSVKKKGVTSKLQDKWEGPYIISERINDVLYRIKNLPSRRSDVVHVDKLKPYEQNELQTEIIDLAQEERVIPSTHATQSGRRSRQPQWYGI